MKPNLPSRKDELVEQELELTQLVEDSTLGWETRGYNSGSSSSSGKKKKNTQAQKKKERKKKKRDGENDSTDGDLDYEGERNTNNEDLEGTTVGDTSETGKTIGDTDVNDGEMFLKSRFEDVLRRFHQFEESSGKSVNKHQQTSHDKSENDKSQRKQEEEEEEIEEKEEEEDLDDKFVADEHRSKSHILTKEHSNEVIPPENFSHVIGEIYRSSFPRVENFKFLSQRLKLKSILMLIPEEYPPENISFLKAASIKLFQVGMSGNKEPFVNLPSDLLTKALEIVLNPENQPILIHCNRGKHRTGCLVGCIRKLQNWSLTMIFDEYRRFAFPKARALDQQFIELYDDEEIKRIASERGWLPLQW